jgi:hypothetical protein
MEPSIKSQFFPAYLSPILEAAATLMLASGQSKRLAESIIVLFKNVALHTLEYCTMGAGDGESGAIVEKFAQLLSVLFDNYRLSQAEHVRATAAKMTNRENSEEEEQQITDLSELLITIGFAALKCGDTKKVAIQAMCKTCESIFNRGKVY